MSEAYKGMVYCYTDESGNVEAVLGFRHMVQDVVEEKDRQAEAADYLKNAAIADGIWRRARRMLPAMRLWRRHPSRTYAMG